MKITAGTQVSNLEFEEFKRFVSQFVEQAASVVNGGIGITENLDVKIVSVTFSAANKTVASNHGLGRVPSGYIVTKSSAAISVFDGNADNSNQILYVQASGAGTVSLLVF